ncbi:helix-turn-helix domain-containing protein [Streptomyces sp. NPDC002205]|uniref:IclR family transcriptional regulator n=1 Tax=Streptomyces sp. NPDC002205 TaxID=3154411 RepID=UPI003324E2A1
MAYENGARRESKGIQAIETGYRVLVAIQQGPQPVALKDIAARADISPSQAHNYLSSFVRTGMVASAGRGAYQLGPSLAALGMTAVQSLDKYELIREEALHLRDRTSLGVAVSIWTDSGPVVVFNKSGHPWGMFELRNGPTSVVHTGGGNIFIAFLESESTRSAALRELAGENVDEDEAEKQLTEIKHFVLSRGYAATELSEMPGYAALSAPVWDSSDQVIYAVTLTGPKERIATDSQSALIAELLKSSAQLSRQFGARPGLWS